MSEVVNKAIGPAARAQGLRGRGRAGAWAAAAAWLLGSATLQAQTPTQVKPTPAQVKPVPGSPPLGPTSASKPPPSARAEAPFDPSGDWVSVITQDWRFRMVVPGRGEYAGVPINLKAKQFADAWKPQADQALGNQCEAYGAPVIMRAPGRLHIRWEDANTLRVDTDAGLQTRLLHFGPPPADATLSPSRQGYSQAQWQMHQAGGPFGPPPSAPTGPQYGSIKVTTDHLLPGLLRKNGLPYSAQSRLTEYWEMHAGPAGAQWLIIPSELNDPEYLRSPYFFNPIFLKEPDGSKWDPTPCSLTW